VRGGEITAEVNSWQRLARLFAAEGKAGIDTASLREQVDLPDDLAGGARREPDW
jgi:hypothetical protein